MEGKYKLSHKDNILTWKQVFEKEIYVWSQLKHPNVLDLLGYAVDEMGFPLLISKWMENGSAWDYIRKHPHLSVSYIRQLVRT